MLPEEPLMEPIDRQRFLHALRSDETFRQEVRRELLTEQLLELPDMVAALVVSVRAQSEQIADNSRQIAELTTAIHEQREDIADLRRSASALIDATAENRRDIAALIEVTAQSSRQIADLRQDVASLTRVTRQLVDTVETGFAVMRDALTGLAASLTQLRSDMNAGFTASNVRLDRVDAEIIDIKQRLAS